MKNLSIFLKIAAILWVIWGAVHILAGVMTMNFILSGNIAGAVGGIADDVDPATLQMDYPAAAGDENDRLLHQSHVQPGVGRRHRERNGPGRAGCGRAARGEGRVRA